MKQPTKAIICAAGLGTRFLPQTKVIPKEMLPIIDKPVIQIIVEKAVAAGVTDIIIVTRGGKGMIEDHFGRSKALEQELLATGKNALAEMIRPISEMANFIFVRQQGDLYGTAMPILSAAHLLDKDEPFYVLFPDDYFMSEDSWLSQLKEAYNETGKSVISLVKIDKKDSEKYGIADIDGSVNCKTFKLNGMIEKPSIEEAPSEYASVGSYLLMPEILPLLERKIVGKAGEVYLADNINDLAKQDAVYGRCIDGVWHDTGDKLKYLKAVVDEALADEKFRKDFTAYLKEKLENKA